MQTIWKFELIDSVTTISLPKESRFLTLQAQNERPAIWFLVNPDKERIQKHFVIVGTGTRVPVFKEYIGTFQSMHGAFVWHVFELSGPNLQYP